jgi:glyoxylase-like metal-dependent hydrolase (beta-lactamase superfamily II)
VKKIAEGIHTWATFSQEKQLDFNGRHLRLDEASILVDPPLLSEEDAAAIEELGRPEIIVLTNKDHRRKAPEARERFGARILVHEREAGLVDCRVDGTFADGDVIAGALEVIGIRDGKSPGETALWYRSRRVLILGDALIGKPPGALSLLPDDKFADPARARAGVAALAELDADMVLVGDGVDVLDEGRAALRAFVSQGRQKGAAG